VDRDALAVTVQAEDARRARVWPAQVEQAPDRGRLARTAGPQEPEHLPRLDTQIEFADR
jgi:hypothetical protein